MVKFCLQCKNAFWGGQFCPKCEGEILLLDAALPENKKYLPELNIDVRPKYFARSSMMFTGGSNSVSSGGAATKAIPGWTSIQFVPGIARTSRPEITPPIPGAVVL